MKKIIFDLLDLLKKHQDFLQKNPIIIAKLMKEYDDLYWGLNFKKYDGNPKYLIVNLEKTLSKKYFELIYDAWCYAGSHSNYEKKTKLENKPNKTMDEIAKMCLDKNYKYNSIYPNRKSVLNRYLCAIGTGRQWSKDGFIEEHFGIYGNSESLFQNFYSKKYPKSLLKDLYWLKDLSVVALKNKRKEEFLKEKNREKELSKILEASKKLLKKVSPELEEIPPINRSYSLIDENSLIYSIPENTHISFKKASIEILEEIIENKDGIENKSNITLAKQLLKKLV